MESRFEVQFSDYFIRQWKEYGEDAQDLLNSKFSLIASNPFRFKKHKGYKGVFKVKLSIEDTYSRLMYAVFVPDNKSIMVLGVFPRKLDYKDFERVFGYMRER